eukprot:6394335-Amphidinium_carterae.1
MATPEQMQQILIQNQELQQVVLGLQQEMAGLKQANANPGANVAQRVQSPIDSRYIGKPEQFTGASGWKDWSVVMRSYA